MFLTIGFETCRRTKNGRHVERFPFWKQLPDHFADVCKMISVSIGAVFCITVGSVSHKNARFLQKNAKICRKTHSILQNPAILFPNGCVFVPLCLPVFAEMNAKIRYNPCGFAWVYG